MIPGRIVAIFVLSFCEILLTGQASLTLRVIRQANVSNPYDWELEMTTLDNTKDCLQSSQNVKADASLEIRRKRSSEDEFHFSDEFLSCNHITVEHGCYQVLPNNSVYVPMYDKLFNVTNYHIDDSLNLYICPDFFVDEGQFFFTSSSKECMQTSKNVATDVEIRRKRSIDPDWNATSNETLREVNGSRFSDEFLSCQHTMVEPGCYQVLPNNSVYVPMYDKLFNATDYIIHDTRMMYICPDFFDEFVDEGKFSSTLVVVSVVGTAISTTCILLHMAMFLVFKKLRNLPGFILFSLCNALLVAYLFSFITHVRSSREDCTAIGVIKAYAFLASFFWMNAMAYDIWRSLRLATAKLRLTVDKPMLTRFGMYSAYCWGTPLGIVIVGIIVDNSPNSDEKYKLIFDRVSCWFVYKQALLVYFASPLFTLLLLNLFMFISSFFMIHSATMKTSENKADLSTRFLVSVRLAVVMGLMWVFGVLATAVQTDWLWYLNVLFNVLQGMFIFFSFTFTEKMRKECRKALQRNKCVAFPSQTNSTHQSTTV